tara:strand:- start:5764 stop:6030 length:267 start_codon:yes stop_codon:yes gene_type:complete
MPTATTSKTTTKAPAKRRTRKTATKVTKTVRIKTSKRPSSARLISSDRYVKDIQTRWAIHQYEVKELFKGFPGYFNFVKTQYAKMNLS